MRAISLWQPWASLWLSPHKVHETRHWSTPYRGWLAVHAAQRLVSDCGEELDDLVCARFGPDWRKTLPRGAIIGQVDLIDVQPTTIKLSGAARDDVLCGDWDAGRFAWRRGGWFAYREPIPFKGHQGFFNVPDDILQSAGDITL